MSTNLPAKPGEKIKEFCKLLGPEYSIQVIDLENVIYRDLHNGYDIEISGLDTGKRNLDISVYVWSTAEGKHIVERKFGIKTINQLVSYLNDVVARGCLNPPQFQEMTR